MYNGLPWPEEEFIKVTIERDLTIDKTFKKNPILWHILKGLAKSRPALCYSSILLRALMAVQLTHWQASTSTVASNNPKDLDVTRKVLELMSIGQFLPYPLNRVQDVIGKFHSFHVHCILVDIWNFMRENVPSPLSYSAEDGNREFDPGKTKLYTERLRKIMLLHLDNMPEDYKLFFVHPL